MSLVRTLLTPLAAIALCASLAACGDETGAVSGSRDTSAPSGELPDSVPPPDGPVTTRGTVTVLDDGDGAELCLGGVAESLPPQCGGPAIAGWDWGDWEGDHEDVSGTRWGEFVVAGEFDGDTLTPVEVVPAGDYQAPPEEDDRAHVTTCQEPAGGWVVDPALTAMTDYEAAMLTARRLDDYASSFVDTSRDPRSLEQMDQELASGVDDVSFWTVNVTVTEDPAAAEAAIREVWGGALCVNVTSGGLTERELRRVQQAINDAEVPGFLYSGVDSDAVELGVVHDDGSIQAWADAEFGEGVVTVGSALVPYAGD